MPLEILTVPCLSDNYAYLIRGDDGVCLVDAPEAGPIVDALNAKGWSLDVVMLTHHHWDHVDATEDLRRRYGCKVTGPKAEKDKLPPLDWSVSEGSNGGNGDAYTEILDVPGHTLGHIAFHFPRAKALFSADSLMALGCGRLFEGTPEMMHKSLQKMAALPPETMIYSGHEYTLGNARFAVTIEPDNQALQARVAKITAAREAGQPTVPVTLAEELATNPFLRCHIPAVQAAVGLEGASSEQVFAEVRARKDSF
ncbi:MAG: hydroxyacylglutathione hydrolase [Pseudoprimorskyibacter sp.]|nr:hydroxyacylglutathione hydrolase [Pseudoprimorskyibacter sp.]